MRRSDHSQPVQCQTGLLAGVKPSPVRIPPRMEGTTACPACAPRDALLVHMSTAMPCLDRQRLQCLVSGQYITPELAEGMLVIRRQTALW
jgi:hypothetical protein